jgi:hypothetical protein
MPPAASVDQAALPPAAAAPPAGSAPPLAPAMPGTLATVSRGLDLSVAASAEIRRTSVYIGVLWLLSIGPLVTVLWAYAARQGGLEWLRQLAAGSRPDLVSVDSSFVFFLFLASVFGVGCLLALSADAQLLATILIGDRATGRPFQLRPALRLTRLRFWRLIRASILVGLILLVPQLFLNLVVMDGHPVGTDAQAVVVNAIGIVLSAPFVYVASGIVLGGVDARETIRRSFRLARTRWRLAFLIAIVNIAVAYIANLALGAGADVLARLGTAFGIGETMGPLQAVVLAAIVAVALVSIGSLTMTIGALTVAPQVVAFFGLTGYADGLDTLDHLDNPFATPNVEPLISRPMKVALTIGVVVAILAVISSN